MTRDTVDVLRGASYDMAEAIAPTWEKRREDIERTAAPVRTWLVKQLGPRPGDTVLELAAGTGDTGFEVARLVAPGGRLICSDFSPSMLAAARRRGEELGVDNVDYRQIDAQRIELETDSVDGVVCRFGYMLMDDAEAAIAETRRVLRPDGRLVLAVWGPPDRNPFFGIIASVLIKRGVVAPPDPTAPGVFTWANDEHSTALLREGGFDDVRTEAVPVTFDVPTVAEYLSVVADTAGAIALAVRALDAADREAITTEIEPALRAFAGNGGYAVPGVALCTVAT